MQSSFLPFFVNKMFCKRVPGQYWIHSFMGKLNSYMIKVNTTVFIGFFLLNFILSGVLVNFFNVQLELFQNLCNFLAQPNQITYLDISSTDCTLETVSFLVYKDGWIARSAFSSQVVGSQVQVSRQGQINIIRTIAPDSVTMGHCSTIIKKSLASQRE